MGKRFTWWWGRGDASAITLEATPDPVPPVGALLWNGRYITWGGRWINIDGHLERALLWNGEPLEWEGQTLVWEGS